MTLKNTLALFGLAAVLLTAKEADAQSNRHLAPPEGQVKDAINNVYFSENKNYGYIFYHDNVIKNIKNTDSVRVFKTVDGQCILGTELVTEADVMKEKWGVSQKKL
jgi:hypothetical protein